jgi:hypothetical protein
MATCVGPACGRPAEIGDLCFSHYQQARRDPGRPLRPLRERREIPLEQASVYVSSECKARIVGDAAGARAALEAWAAKRK